MTVVTASAWSRQHARTTAGVFTLAFVFAFESLAVATVMPVVATDLDGLDLYGASFAAPMAAGVVSLCVAGPWIDRHGPARALAVGLAVFCAGVLAAGAAPTVEAFLLGRLVHGFGAGVLGVALYVLVARAYPESLRPQVFAVLTTGWVLPALVGPLVAAFVADRVGWRWVFVGVVPLAITAWAAIRSAVPEPDDRALAVAGRTWPWALLAAAGVLTLTWHLAGLVLVAVAARRLLPRGAWSGARGLPSIVTTRGLIGASFAGAEVYLPLTLAHERGLSTTAAGLVLGVAALTWCAGAWAGARVQRLRDETTRVRLGAVLVTVGVASVLTVPAAAIPVGVPVVGWAVGGFGIGMSFATLSVLALATAGPGEEGRVSSVVQLNDQLVQSTVLALGGWVFGALVVGSVAAAASTVVAGAVVTAATAVLLTGRLATPVR